MTVTTIYGKDSVTAGEFFVAWRPKYAGASKPGIIFCHGAGSLADMSLTYQSAPQTLSALVRQGHLAIAADLGGKETWGNDTAISRINDAKTYLQGAMGAKPGKVHLVGISMGGQNAFVWAAANPSLVASITVFIPVVNLTDIVTNNRNGAAANANSAYSGGWSEATYGAAHNPLTLASAGALANIPILMYYGQSDTIAVPAQAEAFGAAVGPKATLVSMATGHDMNPYSDSYRQQILSFVGSNS